jgi:uncharacterized protein
MSEITGETGALDPAAVPGAVPATIDGETWQSIAAGRLAAVRRVRSVLALLVLLIVAGELAGNSQGLAGTVVGAAALVGYGTLWYVTGRSARSWRFRERADDLLIDHGLLFHRQIVVPYGRMQFVDVKVDPLDRLLGIATVQLHTAAAASDARIPGLVPAQAQALRDRLAELGQARMSGL